jgi:2-polyprenyl-6-methoxyphenol hydroxylase-like FAD-dependent oxidoreductase
MAMADAYVLAQELQRHDDNHREAFQAYEDFLKPSVASKQRDAAWFADLFVPTERSHPALRHAVTRLIFSPLLARTMMSYAGANSVLAGRA